MKGYVYLPFIVVLALAITFIAIKVPETQNKTFDEVAEKLSGNKGLAYREDGEEMQNLKT